MDNTNKDIAEFERVVKEDYKIFVDTSSLMNKDAEYVFFKKIAPILHKYQKILIVPKSVLNEISKHNHNNHKNIKIANNILSELAKFQLYGTNSKFDEEFADNAITAQFMELRLKYNLCLITNDFSKRKDGNLAQDILDLKYSRSTDNIKDIKVFYIKDKTLFEYKKNKSIFSFSLPNKPYGSDTPLNPNYVPKEGDYVLDNLDKKHKLVKQVGRTGGEGSVYLTDTGYACKIYKADRNTLFKRKKIELLINNNIKVKNVALPELMAFNEKKEFVGYLMPKVDGIELKTAIFIPPLLKSKFPDWNRIHLVKVALNILRRVEKLHNYNIILGDINPSNILVKNENEIYFIDTDSFQIEGYPCPVGMVPYTKPIHHGKRYDSYLRTKEDDIFAVATLIFQIMLPGKLPYSFKGGGREKENMRPENFPYRCYDGEGYKNVPEGQWAYIWSHLPRRLKMLFCRIFKKGEDVKIEELIKEMSNYLYQLERGHQTIDIFPRTYKQIDKDGNVLKNDFKEFVCDNCGGIFAIHKVKIEKIKKKGWKLPSKCEYCRGAEKANLKKCTKCKRGFDEENFDICKRCRGRNITCNSCGKLFFFSDSEKEFFDKKNLIHPKRCKECREKKNISLSHSTSDSNNLKSIRGFISSLFKF